MEQRLAESGVVVLRGVPVTSDRRRAAEVVAPFLRRLGEIAPQDGTGSWYHVIVNDEEGRQQETAVAYPTTTDAFEFHSDAAFRPSSEAVDIVALLCVSAAARGGDTYLLRVEDLVAWLAHHRSETLVRLAQPFPFAAASAGPAGAADQVVWVPVLGDGPTGTTCRVHRWRILSAYDSLRQRPDPATLAALDAIGAAFAAKELMTTTRLLAGDMLLIDNHTVLHARSAYEDAHTSSRCLLRLWLRLRGPVG